MKTHLFFCLAALLALTGCASKATVPPFENEIFLREKAEFEPSIGKDFWIKTIAFLCNAPGSVGAHCDPILTNTKLHTDSLEQGAYGTPYYHVTLSDSRSGYIVAAELMIGATGSDPALAAAECKRRGDPRIGMSAKQVRASCWGDPDRVDRRQTARGVSERYVYGKSRFVLLHNGIVTSVQTSGRLR